MFDKAHCIMGKYGNNIERHGDEQVPAWTIPITGVMIDAHLLCILLGDPRGSDAFFERKGDTLEPRAWLAKTDPILLTDKYDGTHVTLELGDEVLEVERCRIKDIKLGRWFIGGMTQIDFALQLEPGLARANLLLQEYQNESIVLTVEHGKIAAKKKLKQRDWIEGTGSSSGEVTSGNVGGDDEADDDAVTSPELNALTGVASDDPLYAQAVEFVLDSRLTTVGALSDRLRIGWMRAAMLLGAMEVAGTLGPLQANGAREFLHGPVPLRAQETPPDDAPGDGEPEEIIGDSPDIQPAMAMDEPTSRIGRAVTAHAKRQARKSRAKKNGEARAH